MKNIYIYKIKNLSHFKKIKKKQMMRTIQKHSKFLFKATLIKPITFSITDPPTPNPDFTRITKLANETNLLYLVN